MHGLRVVIKWFKNVLILGLAALCVHQTIRLWFDDTSSLNFLYTLGYTNNESYNYNELVRGFIRPKRMLYSMEGSEFISKYTGITDTEQYQEAEQILEMLLKTGEHKGTFKLPSINWAEYLSGKILIFDYGFLMPSTAFTASLLSKSTALNTQISEFDMILFMPENDGFRIVFADTLSDEKTVCTFSVSNEGFDFGSMENEQNLWYIASEPHGINFGSLGFMPHSYDKGLNYRGIKVWSPFDSGTIMNVNSVSKLVENYFDNPYAIRSDVTDGVYVLSDEYTRVRYRDNMFLEYSSWRSRNGKNFETIEAAYAEAVAFIGKDPSLVNEYYLAGYDDNGNAYVFYFDYAVNNLPIRLGENLRVELQMDHAIEITVSKDRVSHYKRYASGFVNDESRTYTLRIDYVTTVLSSLQKFGIGLSMYNGVKAVELVYSADNYSRPSLAVRVDYDGAVLSMPIRD